MVLSLRKTVRSGFVRLGTRNGLLLICVFVVVGVLQGGFVWVLSTTFVPLDGGTPVLPTARAGPTPGTTLPTSAVVPAVFLGAVMGGVFTIPVQVVAIRTMVSDHTDRIPEEFVLHNMGWATLHTFLGSVVTAALVVGSVVGCLVAGFHLLFSFASQSTQLWLVESWLGLLCLGVFVLVLLAPGVFFGVSLLFVGQEIAVKDRTVLGGIYGSWRRCRNHRLRLLALVVASLLIQAGVFLLISLLDATPAQIVSLIETAIAQTAMVTIMARAYVAIHNESVTPVASETHP